MKASGGKDAKRSEGTAALDGVGADVPKSSLSDESSLLLSLGLKTMRFTDLAGFPLLSGDGVSGDARTSRLLLMVLRHFVVEDEAICPKQIMLILGHFVLLFLFRVTN